MLWALGRSTLTVCGLIDVRQLRNSGLLMTSKAYSVCQHLEHNTIMPRTPYLVITSNKFGHGMQSSFCYNHGMDSLHYAILISQTGLVIFFPTYLIQQCLYYHMRYTLYYYHCSTYVATFVTFMMPSLSLPQDIVYSLIRTSLSTHMYISSQILVVEP